MRSQRPHAATRSILRLLIPALAGMLALAGCGSSSSSSSSSASTAASAPASTTTSTASTPSASASAGEGSAGALSVAADPQGQLKFDKTTLEAKAGKVAIAFTNSSPVAHNVTVESSSGSSEGATPTFQGGSKTITLNLKPGTYKFFCTVPGHRMAGMEGTLTVH